MIELKTFTLKENDRWLGQIVITSDGGFFSITDWGNFNFAWRSYKSIQEFEEFLLGLNTGYFANKMFTGISYIASTKAIDKACERYAEKILPALQAAIKAGR